VAIEAFLAACTVVMDIPFPPAGMLTLLGLNEIVRLAFVTCAVRDTVPENPWVLRRETVDVAFMP